MGFYLDRAGRLHGLNPLTKLTLALALSSLAFIVPWAWFSLALFAGVIVPLSVWGNIGRELGRATVRLLLPTCVFLIVVQSLVFPGQTVLFKVGELAVKTEAVTSAVLTAGRLLVMVGAFLLMLFTAHPGVLMTDLTRRGVPPTFAYLIIATLQIMPAMRDRAATILDAQQARGLETRGSLLTRTRAIVPLVGPLILGALVQAEERALAIQARAFYAGRKHTSLIEVPDSPRETLGRWVMIGVVIAAGGLRLIGLVR